MHQETEVLIIGAGIAGGVAALKLAQQGRRVILICSQDKGCSSSYMAQGGVVYKGRGDSFDLLCQDIIHAGAGMCYPPAVKFLAEQGPGLVHSFLLNELKVPFDSNEEGLCLTEEAAHSCPRILYYKDSSGEAIMKALWSAIDQYSNITVLEHHAAIDLMTLSHQSQNPLHVYERPTCIGAYVLDSQTLKVRSILARETILATGGVGEVYLHTTNPQGSNGSGIAMAYRAGVRIMNMEYVQFHPTTLYVPNDSRRFLLSEALRGEGAILLSEDLRAFMSEKDGLADLAPRDVVARGIYQEMLTSRANHVWLRFFDKPADWIRSRFPKIYDYCLSKGFDLGVGLVPVVPAEHYHCGGVCVDLEGRTTMHRLRAIGEVSCTGVHGANRLASVSLLEGVVWGHSCAESVGKRLSCESDIQAKVSLWKMEQESVDVSLIQQDWMTIKQTMWNYVGLVRDKQRLKRAYIMLSQLKETIDEFYGKSCLTPQLLGLRHGILTALLITQGAMRNPVSSGCHFVIDEQK